MTVDTQIADISKDVETELPKILKKYVYYPLTVDESMDITSTVQMVVVECGVNCDQVLNFQIAIQC
jgi:hypothetical protein